MTRLQECDLDINLVHIIKGHGLFLLAKKVMEAKEEEDILGWEQEIEMYNIKQASCITRKNSWYADLRQYLQHDIFSSHFST